MCIICSDPDLGDQYLNAIDIARNQLRVAEDAMLKLGKKYPASNYSMCHKKLVKIRKSINEVEELREKHNKH